MLADLIYSLRANKSEEPLDVLYFRNSRTPLHFNIGMNQR